MNNDIRNLQKWLNEEQEAPIDRKALARVLAMVEQSAPEDSSVAQPIYQCQDSNGKWTDQAKHSYDYNVKHRSATVRVVYLAPQPAQQQEPVGEITAEDMGRPFNAIRIGTHFYKAVPPVGTKLYTSSQPAQQEARIAQLEAELMRMQGRELKLQFALAEQPAQQQEPVPAAMKTVIEAMQADPDYAWSWHCNVAMAFVDAGGDHYTGNQGAARFMKMLANVEPAYELPSPQPAQQQEACPTCGEYEPRTGTCGTSPNDKRALCNRNAPQPAMQEPVAWRWSESNGQRFFDWTTDWSHHDKAKSMGFPIEYAYASPQPAQEPVAWMEMVVANLVREGVNKHKARELAQHFYTSPPAQRKPLIAQEIRAWWMRENGLEDCEMTKLDDFEKVIRAVEAKHNIK